MTYHWFVVRAYGGGPSTTRNGDSSLSQLLTRPMHVMLEGASSQGLG